MSSPGDDEGERPDPARDGRRASHDEVGQRRGGVRQSRGRITASANPSRRRTSWWRCADSTPVAGVRELSVAECRAYVKTWDSSDYAHRKRDAWHVQDFNRFARFADAETDAREGASDFVGARGEAAAASRDVERRTEHAAETVRRQAADRIEEKKKAAFREARRARRIREGEALVKCLREEMAVYAAQRAPAVGGVDAPHVRG